MPRPPLTAAGQSLRQPPPASEASARSAEAGSARSLRGRGLRRHSPGHPFSGALRIRGEVGRPLLAGSCVSGGVWEDAPAPPRAPEVREGGARWSLPAGLQRPLPARETPPRAACPRGLCSVSSVCNVFSLLSAPHPLPAERRSFCISLYVCRGWRFRALSWNSAVGARGPLIHPCLDEPHYYSRPEQYCFSEIHASCF